MRSVWKTEMHMKNIRSSSRMKKRKLNKFTNRFKFNWHTVCLVCFKKLPHPDNRGTDCEHVIPKNIGGFWKSFDICDDCKRHFGDHVDNLSLANPHIINALDSINTENNSKINPILKYKSNDKFKGNELTMFRRGNEYKINTKESDNSIICPDVDAHKIGLDWIKKKLKNEFSENDIHEEFNILYAKYNELDNNESIYSDKLGIRLYKGVNSKITFDESSFRNITPLIAKIATIFLGYVLPFEDLKKVSNYYSIRDHARLNKPLLKTEIIWRPIFKGNKCEKFHKVTFKNFGETGVVEVTLLRYPNWTVFLDYNEKIELYNDEGILIEEISFVFDFENIKKRIFAYRLKGEDQIVNFEL